MKQADMHPIKKAKMDRQGLQELVRDGLVLDKKGVKLFIPAKRIVLCGTTRKMAQFMFSAYTPERPMQYGNDIRNLKPFYSLGFVEYDMDKERFIQDSIRFIRFRKGKDGQELYDIVKNRILRWIGEKLGIEKDELLENDKK